MIHPNDPGITERQRIIAWSCAQILLRHFGKLPQSKIDKYNEAGFDWDFYEDLVNEIEPNWKDDPKWTK